MRIIGLIFMALIAVSPAQAFKKVKIIEPIAADIIAKSHIVETRVILNENTKAVFVKLEEKAAAKRAKAGLSPVDPGATPMARPKPDDYATLPISQMFPLVVDDEAQDWGLTSGRAIKLTVEFDTLKTADAGMAMLMGSYDELAGLVDVSDAATGERLGEFYIDVIRFRSGLVGLAMRGSGVRENLALGFSQRIIEQLVGSRKKPEKKV